MKHAKRYLGLLVATAMFIGAAIPGADVSAAAKPKLSTKSVKVEVGVKKKVTVKKASGYKITVKSKKKAIAAASKKGKSAFVVKGVKAGKTTVVCTAKKGKKKVTLKCAVTVTDSAKDTASSANNQNPTGQNQTGQNQTDPSGNGNQGTNANQPANVTPEPTVGPFPETDKDYVAPYGYDETKNFITYGKAEDLDYTSSSTGNSGKVSVYLPNKYSADKKYPVLYLLNDNTNNWDDMSAVQIFTNAMSFKQANQMIVVKTPYDTTEDFVKDFADGIMPAVEKKYSAATGRVYTAVAGCDQAGTIALRIGIALSDKVAYVGAFIPNVGAIPYGTGEEKGFFERSEFRIPEGYADQELIMIMNAWNDDYTPTAPSEYKQTLEQHGTECLYFTAAKNVGAEAYKEGLYNFVRRVFKRGTNDEGISNEFVASLNVVPTSNFPNLNKPGRNEVVYYDTYTYDEGNSLPMHKYANVYLPYGYDENKQYNILYLMHGGGENAETWIVGDNRYGDYTHNQDMVNYLFASGYCEPCIIVTPTFYRTDDVPTPENARDLTELFKTELRKDLIPAIEAKYHTYADFDTTEDSLIASRMHRAFAGFSMGSGTTYASAFYANYDMFAWFAPYSGVFVDEDQYDAETDRFLKIIEDGASNGMPLGFFYSGNGTADWVMDAQYAIMYRALAKSDYLIAGRNFDFVMIPEAEHNMWAWHVHLYNTLKILFTERFQ